MLAAMFLFRSMNSSYVHDAVNLFGKFLFTSSANEVVFIFLVKIVRNFALTPFYFEDWLHFWLGLTFVAVLLNIVMCGIDMVNEIFVFEETSLAMFTEVSLLAKMH